MGEKDMFRKLAQFLGDLSEKRRENTARQRIQCLSGNHDVPPNAAFEKEGEVFQGGFCRVCGALVYGRFLGNAWTAQETLTVMVPDPTAPYSQELAEELKQAQTKEARQQAFLRIREAAERGPSIPQKVTIRSRIDLRPFRRQGWKVKSLS